MDIKKKINITCIHKYIFPLLKHQMFYNVGAEVYLHIAPAQWTWKFMLAQVVFTEHHQKLDRIVKLFKVIYSI